jgi:hypothetical protein
MLLRLSIRDKRCFHCREDEANLPLFGSRLIGPLQRRANFLHE